MGIMRTKAYKLIGLAVILSVAAIAAIAIAEDSQASREYQVKAAFLYNFIQFVEWPPQKLSDSSKSINIAILGKDPFGKAFEPIKDKKIKGKDVVIKRYKSFEEMKNLQGKDSSEPPEKIEALAECHLLFICSSEREKLKEIINVVKDYSILTVGEMDGFLEAGGIINWFVEDNKVRFEINLYAAEKSNLEIRSKLLRLAKRIIEEDSSQAKEK